MSTDILCEGLFLDQEAEWTFPMPPTDLIAERLAARLKELGENPDYI